MRYVIAMICGLAGAAAAGRLVAVQLAPWMSAQFSYTSPDGAASVEQWTFIGVLGAGSAVGWALGWAIGTPFAQRRRGG